MQRIGIDLGGTKTEGVLIDDSDRQIERVRVATPASRGYEAIVETVASLVRQLGGGGPAGLPVGIGTPGSIDKVTGLVRNSNTTCLNGRPLKADIEQRLDQPVAVANDADCLALSEWYDGAAQGYDCVFAIILGTGVGGGIVTGGRIVNGPHGIAGEWGHNVLDPAGPPCYCGKRGCVETLLCGPALERGYRALTGSALRDASEVWRLLEANDRAARIVTARYLDYFGMALAAVVNILDPDVIVLGGGMSNAPPLYELGPARVARRVFSPRWSVPFRQARHGDSSGVLGAARLAR